ncbi:hypothetical protein C8R46DRAFT_1319166 [Mycena filopes]|nr:hypothetical protein C8R46DRAFT_1319166 [Mycena filopes]
MSPRLHTPNNFDDHISDLVLAFAVTDIVLISLVLATCVWTALNPVSRAHLNRVSFRLLVYALVANLGYAGIMISGTKLGPGAACNGNAFFGNSCLMFAGVMFFSMALNLELVLVHGVNGQNMEKYYILAGVAMTLACNVPPYAAGAFGYWDANATCWFNSPDPAVQLRWMVGTQGFWMFLMSAGEVAAFLTIVAFMIMRHRVTAAISSETSSTMSGLKPMTLPTPPIVAYRSTILRIGLYPLVSCFFSVTGGVLDLNTIRDPIYTEVNWRLGIVDLLVYTLRPMVYALLAATDPSLWRALRALRDSKSGGTGSGVRVNLSANTRRSSATSSGGDPEIGLNSVKTEVDNAADESEESFTRQI